MKASPATVQARVEEILRIVLDGAKTWDIRAHVAEKEAEGEPPWTVEEGNQPLGERQIRRYVARAEALIVKSLKVTRKKTLRRRIAQREALYARAVAQGDTKAALAILRDLDELAGNYPPRKVAPVSPDGKSEYGTTLTDAERAAALAALYARLGAKPGGETPEGTASADGQVLGGPEPTSE
jgi:hypothetical protein